MQLTHYNTKFDNKIFPATLVCDQVSNALNIGSLFRIADAFGIEKLVFCGKHIPMGRKMTKTSRATEKYVNYEVHESSVEAVEKLKEQNYQIISLEITSKSQSLNHTTFKINQPIALVVGDENFGISEDILKLSNQVIHIDMFGHNSSMNVVQATSIALYEITKQMVVKS